MNSKDALNENTSLPPWRRQRKNDTPAVKRLRTQLYDYLAV
jgi:hypothetical protein